MKENSYQNRTNNCPCPNSSTNSNKLTQFEDVIRKYLREVPGPDQDHIELMPSILTKPAEFHRPWTVEEQANSSQSHQSFAKQSQQSSNSISITPSPKQNNIVHKHYSRNSMDKDDDLHADIPWTVLEKSIPPHGRRIYQNSNQNKSIQTRNKYSLVSPYNFGKRRPYQILKRSRSTLVDYEYATPPSTPPPLNISPLHLQLTSPCKSELSLQHSTRTIYAQHTNPYSIEKGISENITKLQKSTTKYLSQLERKSQVQPTPYSYPSYKLPITYEYKAIPLIDMNQMTVEKMHELESLGVISMIPLVGNEHVFYNI